MILRLLRQYAASTAQRSNARQRRNPPELESLRH